MKKTFDLNTMKKIALEFRRELIIFAVFIFVYWPTFLWMWDRWFVRDSYYSHGILVPFVTAFLIWQKRKMLESTPRESSAGGLRLVILGIVIHFISSLFRVYFSSGFSMLIVLFGLILHFFGRKILDKIVFPISFLVFMIPLPMVVITNISFKMKLFAAQIAAWTLNAIHIPAIREGSMLKMKHSYVIVDDVCSGLRSLISLTALGSIFAYWLKSSMARKIFLFLTTIPIAIITNVFRVIVLSVISEVWGPKYAVGAVHDITGFLAFGLAFVLLYFVSKLME